MPSCSNELISISKRSRCRCVTFPGSTPPIRFSRNRRRSRQSLLGRAHRAHRIRRRRRASQRNRTRPALRPHRLVCMARFANSQRRPQRRKKRPLLTRFRRTHRRVSNRHRRTIDVGPARHQARHSHFREHNGTSSVEGASIVDRSAVLKTSSSQTAAGRFTQGGFFCRPLGSRGHGSRGETTSTQR